MADRVKVENVEAFQQQARGMIEQLDAMTESGVGSHGEATSEVGLIAGAARMALEAAAAGLGECREETPYAPLYPLIENGTFKWCCTHDPSHCSA